MQQNKERVMKIHVWIPIEDAVINKLNPDNWSTVDPDNSKWVQVSITPDQLQRLIDEVKETEMLSEEIDKEQEYLTSQYTTNRYSDEWLVNQYNRNRPEKEWVSNINELRQKNN